MKRRHGFVSNSSSSSFICDVCGVAEEGYDGPSDAGMLECENGHYFCTKHAVNKDQSGTVYDEYIEETCTYANFDDCESNGEVSPAIYCPICTFNALSDYDFIEYMKTKGYTKAKALEEIKATYPDYKSFYESVVKA